MVVTPNDQCTPLSSPSPCSGPQGSHGCDCERDTRQHCWFQDLVDVCTQPTKENEKSSRLDVLNFRLQTTCVGMTQTCWEVTWDLRGTGVDSEALIGYVKTTFKLVTRELRKTPQTSPTVKNSWEEQR